MVLMLAIFLVNAASKCRKVVYLYSVMLQINFRGLDTTYPRPSCDVKKNLMICIISLAVAC